MFSTSLTRLILTRLLRDESGASAVELRRKAMEEGMIGLRQSGLQKIRDGITTIDEVVRESVL